MMYRSILVCLFSFMATTAFAHGTGQHVLGTVTAIDATHVEVKTPKGKTVDVQVNKQTRFKEKGNLKSTNVPVVGDRVVIEATKDNKVLRAIEINFSSATRVPAPVQPVQVQ
ncbi:MAG: DUF5666 domain-containing protein [Nitrospirota bacterium]|nr:DUF5666 domain-containing protein [Nitrospirota bacterium]MDP2383113.1 DUF5666 domain-containing protein [Nitrospirota bacterium]MDP3599313.1 DUF5666 domain-containing protein [Nitrospirota bacterium]